MSHLAELLCMVINSLALFSRILLLSRCKKKMLHVTSLFAFNVLWVISIECEGKACRFYQLYSISLAFVIKTKDVLLIANCLRLFTCTNHEASLLTVFLYLFLGEGDSGQGIKCSGSQMSGDSVRRCSRPISRFNGTVSDRRTLTWHELLIHGRLRWSRLLLGRDSDSPGRSEGPLSRANHHSARKSRIATNYASVWLLWRVSPQIWQSECVEVLHWSVRLSAPHRPRWWSNILLAWRTVAVDVIALLYSDTSKWF